jgi:hypothetical protein
MTFQNLVGGGNTRFHYIKVSKTSISEKFCKMQIKSLVNTTDKIPLNCAYNCELKEKSEFRFDTS